MENVASITTGLLVFAVLIIAYRLISGAWDRNAAKGAYKPHIVYARPERARDRLGE